MCQRIDKKFNKPCRLVTAFCGFTGATAAEGLLGGALVTVLLASVLDCVSFFFGWGWELVTLSDDSESELLSELPEDAEPPELFELAELSDFCGCTGFATIGNVTKTVLNLYFGFFYGVSYRYISQVLVKRLIKSRR